MANHKSAEKRIRRNARRDVINSARRSSIRTIVKKVEAALLAGDVKKAEAELKAAQPAIDRGAAKRVVSKKAAARIKSRLSSRVKALKGKKAA